MDAGGVSFVSDRAKPREKTAVAAARSKVKRIRFKRERLRTEDPE